MLNEVFIFGKILSEPQEGIVLIKSEGVLPVDIRESKIELWGYCLENAHVFIRGRLALDENKKLKIKALHLQEVDAGWVFQKISEVRLLLWITDAEEKSIRGYTHECMVPVELEYEKGNELEKNMRTIIEGELVSSELGVKIKVEKVIPLFSP